LSQTFLNGLPAAAGHPDLMALVADDLCREKDASAPLRHPVAALKPEAAGTTVDNLKELTKAISRGDEAAFTRFYDLYSLRLYKHLLVLAKGNEAEAREVLQTVVVKLAKGFKVFDEERRMWGWVCRLARNAYVDLCRARRRAQRFVPLEEHKPDLMEDRDGENQLSESLHHALEQLTAEEQELIRAAYVDERPLQELANASGQSYKAVESRLARLRQKLKTNLLKHLRHEDGA
jgi:RNA polymerase sigma-70 factor (ECF subfamily)